MQFNPNHKLFGRPQVQEFTKHFQIPTQNWVPTMKSEIEAFIGMSILMSIHQLPEMQHYWSSDLLLSVPAISNVMTSKRLKKNY